MRRWAIPRARPTLCRASQITPDLPEWEENGTASLRTRSLESVLLSPFLLGSCEPSGGAGCQGTGTLPRLSPGCPQAAAHSLLLITISVHCFLVDHLDLDLGERFIP